MATNIKVAVRVRPFTPRECKAQCTCVVSVEGNTVLVDKQSIPKAFTYDYAYWSHNPASKHFATQEAVVGDLAGAVLQNGLAGFNGCLFAYGQTGSGKTYSVLGSVDAIGMVPWTFRQLLDEKEKLEATPDKDLRLYFSYLEIYNDRIYDLLSPDGDKAAHLNVMDHPKFGAHIPGLIEVPCRCIRDFERHFAFGMKRRAIAATRMNCASSRSHAVVCLRVQRLEGPPPEAGNIDTRHEISSRMNLVDLAGSERQSRSVVEGDAYRETCLVNRSLSALCLIIKELAEVSSRSNGNPQSPLASIVGIPFRCSKLTFLLKDSLAGNSKTYMLAAVSPASDCMEETLSTLRFASSVKAIRTVAVVNKTKRDLVIDALTRELDDLKQQMRTMKDRGHQWDSQNFIVSAQEDLVRKMSSTSKEDLAFADQIRKSQKKKLTDMALADSDSDTRSEKDTKELDVLTKGSQCPLCGARLANATEMCSFCGRRRGSKKVGTTPYLLSMAEDPMLAGCLVYYLPRGKRTTFGAADDNVVSLFGLGLCDYLCEVQNIDDSDVIIRKCSAEGRVRVGGRILDERESQILRHGDRIFLGRSHAFRVVAPLQAVDRTSTDVSVDNFLEGCTQDELAVVDDSPLWHAVRDHLDLLVKRLAPGVATSLLQEVRDAIQFCEEAAEIAVQCKRCEDWIYRVDLTTLEPLSVIVIVQRTQADGATKSLYTWSVAEMETRLDRMRDYFDAFGDSESADFHELDDPWRPASHESIMATIGRLQVIIDDTVRENIVLKNLRTSSMQKILLQFHSGDKGSLLRPILRAWRELTKVVRKAMESLSVSMKPRLPRRKSDSYSSEMLMRKRKSTGAQSQCSGRNSSKATSVYSSEGSEPTTALSKMMREARRLRHCSEGAGTSEDSRLYSKSSFSNCDAPGPSSPRSAPKHEAKIVLKGARAPRLDVVASNSRERMSSLNTPSSTVDEEPLSPEQALPQQLGQEVDLCIASLAREPSFCGLEADPRKAMAESVVVSTDCNDATIVASTDSLDAPRVSACDLVSACAVVSAYDRFTTPKAFTPPVSQCSPSAESPLPSRLISLNGASPRPSGERTLPPPRLLSCQALPVRRIQSAGIHPCRSLSPEASLPKAAVVCVRQSSPPPCHDLRSSQRNEPPLTSTSLSPRCGAWTPGPPISKLQRGSGSLTACVGSASPSSPYQQGFSLSGTGTRPRGLVEACSPARPQRVPSKMYVSPSQHPERLGAYASGRYSFGVTAQHQQP